MNAQLTETFRDDSDRLMTEREVAAYLRIQPRQLFNWRMAGLIPYIKIGKAVRFRASDLKEALSRFEVNAASRRAV